MDLTVDKTGDVVVLEPAGAITARAAAEFERAAEQQISGGARRLAVDFGKVDLITGDGLRVLVLLAQHLRGADGKLILFGMSDAVRSVFEAAGLLTQFQIVEARAEAVARLEAATAPRRAAAASKLARLTARLLSDGPAPAAEAPPAPAALSQQLRDVFGSGRA